jgi:hypothetical protein
MADGTDEDAEVVLGEHGVGKWKHGYKVQGSRFEV